jgi:signal transduction histidine kinase
LGLSVAYGIIKEHRGLIKVRSKAGHGSAFIIELPLAETAISTNAKGGANDSH